MKELIEAFRQEMLKQLQEDIKRSEKWKLEDEVYKEILKCLMCSSENEIVCGNYTQNYIFYNLNGSVFFNVEKYNLKVYLFFENVGWKESSPEHCASWDIINRTISVNLYDIVKNIKPLYDIKSTKIYLSALLRSKKCGGIFHHEIANKMFSDRYKDLSRFNNQASEHNSELSELYHYMVIRNNINTNNIDDILKFFDYLKNSDNRYDVSLWYRTSSYDQNKLIQQIQRFKRYDYDK